MRPGDVIDVDRLVAEEGSSVELADVLAISKDGELTIGKPIVPQASVSAHVQAHDKDKKIIVFKYKRKVRYRRKKGHRQHYTRLAITSIVMDGEEIAVVEEPQPTEPLPAEEQPDALDKETVLEVTADPGEEPSAETTVGEPDTEPTPHATTETSDEQTGDASLQLDEALEGVESQPPEATPIEAASPKTPKKAKVKALATSKKTPKKALEKNK